MSAKRPQGESPKQESGIAQPGSSIEIVVLIHGLSFENNNDFFSTQGDAPVTRGAARQQRLPFQTIELPKGVDFLSKRNGIHALSGLDPLAQPRDIRAS